ncbi:MAG: LPS assembly protein LptD, partial [Pseudomonadota bacterium]
MSRRACIFVWCAALIAQATLAFAQQEDRASRTLDSDSSEPAILIADDVFLSGDETLVASGQVEALFEGRRLEAQEIVYDRANEQLRITGPIRLIEADGTIVVLADSAELDRDIANGLMRGARLVFNDQVQLAAVELARTNGRYNSLLKAAVTSCRICKTGEPPLWQIRARRVIHDQQERQLYFEDAQLNVMGTPVLYLPRLRLPDPTQERATGFLFPSLRNSSLLGFGAEIPYFIVLGVDKDLTLTPYITDKTRTIQGRYRQVFRNGRIELEGAISDDDLVSDVRTYLFGEGTFALPDDYLLRFNIETTSDKTYLLDYGFSDKDRLESNLIVQRARRNEFIGGALSFFQSLRVNESNATLPSFAVDGEYERRV